MAMKFEKKGDGLFLLDVKGYVCPHPQIYSKKALEKIKEGDILEVQFDNPSSAESITMMCEQLGMHIIDKKQDGANFTYKIKK